jgi:hypothetical protein
VVSDYFYSFGSVGIFLRGKRHAIRRATALPATARAFDVATHIVGIHLFNETLNMRKLPGTEYPCNLTRSPISERELERAYNIDSMTEMDFLKYNYSELLNLTSHGYKKQKNWLKDYLQTDRNSAEQASATRRSPQVRLKQKCQY